jgi:hypothetical protein
MVAGRVGAEVWARRRAWEACLGVWVEYGRMEGEPGSRPSLAADTSVVASFKREGARMGEPVRWGEVARRVGWVRAPYK